MMPQDKIQRLAQPQRAKGPANKRPPTRGHKRPGEYTTTAQPQPQDQSVIDTRPQGNIQNILGRLQTCPMPMRMAPPGVNAYKPLTKDEQKNPPPEQTSPPAVYQSVIDNSPLPKVSETKRNLFMDGGHEERQPLLPNAETGKPTDCCDCCIIQ